MFKEGDRVRVRHHTEYEKENYEFRWTGLKVQYVSSAKFDLAGTSYAMSMVCNGR